MSRINNRFTITAVAGQSWSVTGGASVIGSTFAPASGTTLSPNFIATGDTPLPSGDNVLTATGDQTETSRAVGAILLPSTLYDTSATYDFLVVADSPHNDGIEKVEVYAQGGTSAVSTTVSTLNGANGYAFTLSLGAAEQLSDTTIYARLTPYNGYSRVVSQVIRVVDHSDPANIVSLTTGANLALTIGNGGGLGDTQTNDNKIVKLGAGSYSFESTAVATGGGLAWHPWQVVVPADDLTKADVTVLMHAIGQTRNAASSTNLRGGNTTMRDIACTVDGQAGRILHDGGSMTMQNCTITDTWNYGSVCRWEGCALDELSQTMFTSNKGTDAVYECYDCVMNGVCTAGARVYSNCLLNSGFDPVYMAAIRAMPSYDAKSGVPINTGEVFVLPLIGGQTEPAGSSRAGQAVKLEYYGVIGNEAWLENWMLNGVTDTTLLNSNHMKLRGLSFTDLAGWTTARHDIDNGDNLVRQVGLVCQATEIFTPTGRNAYTMYGSEAGGSNNVPWTVIDPETIPVTNPQFLNKFVMSNVRNLIGDNVLQQRNTRAEVKVLTIESVTYNGAANQGTTVTFVRQTGFGTDTGGGEKPWTNPNSRNDYIFSYWDLGVDPAGLADNDAAMAARRNIYDAGTTKVPSFVGTPGTTERGTVLFKATAAGISGPDLTGILEAGQKCNLSIYAHPDAYQCDGGSQVGPITLDNLIATDYYSNQDVQGFFMPGPFTTIKNVCWNNNSIFCDAPDRKGNDSLASQWITNVEHMSIKNSSLPNFSVLSQRTAGVINRPFSKMRISSSIVSVLGGDSSSSFATQFSDSIQTGITQPQGFEEYSIRQGYKAWELVDVSVGALVNGGFNSNPLYPNTTQGVYDMLGVTTNVYVGQMDSPAYSGYPTGANDPSIGGTSDGPKWRREWFPEGNFGGVASYTGAKTLNIYGAPTALVQDAGGSDMVSSLPAYPQSILGGTRASGSHPIGPYVAAGEIPGTPADYTSPVWPFAANLNGWYNTPV